MTVAGEDTAWPDELARRTAQLESAESLAGMGSWEWIPDAGELRWSDNLFRIFGLSPGEITPSLESAFEQLHPDDRERVEHQSELLRVGRMAPLEYRIVLPDGAIRHLRATITVVEQDADRPMRIVGLVQDLTEPRRAQQTLAAHVAVTRVLLEWESLDQSAEGLLSSIAVAMDFEVGVLWLPRKDVLICQTYWQAGSIESDEFESATRVLRYPRGAGLPGRAWEGGQPMNLLDVGAESNRKRRELAVNAGLRGALAFPLLDGEEVLAVLEFYSGEQGELTPALTRALQAIGHELGQFLAHRHGEFQPPPLTRRELEVLQLAARGGSGREIARELGVSPATVKTHLGHIYEKLGVTDRAGAVAMVLREGLID
jgi:PAS domain S-box-containing protein